MTEVVTESEIIETVQENTQTDDNGERKWCVYCHTNKINGKKYFGITSKQVEERWKNGYGYAPNTIFRKAVNKYTWNGFDHEIIANNLTETEAKQKEVELIALFQTNCLKYTNPSYGYNMTDGGDGVFGYQHTEEWKQQHSKSMCGENNPSYGKTIQERLGSDGYVSWLQKQRDRNRTGENNPMYGISPQERMDDDTFKQWIEKLRVANSGKNNPNYGKPMSEEQKQKISNAKTGKKLSDEEKARRLSSSPVKTPVYCFELCMYYKSAAEAERKTGVCARTILSYCSGDPTRKSAGKHPVTGVPLHWKKVSPEDYYNFINNLKQKGND